MKLIEILKDEDIEELVKDVRKYNYRALRPEDKDFALGIKACITCIKNNTFIDYLHTTDFPTFEKLADEVREDMRNAIIDQLEEELNDYYAECIDGYGEEDVRK